jgi:hypothetical protein
LVKTAPSCHQERMSGLAALTLSILMLAAFGLTAGGVWLVLKGRDRRKGGLMIVAAIVMLGNALIWSW